MRKAFTILELTIVITIMGFMSFTFFGVIDSYIKVNSYKTTFKRIDEIEIAFLKYLKNNKGLPCPASSSLSFDKDGYGENGDSCVSGNTSFSCDKASKVFEGGVVVGYKGSVPAVTLGLPAEIMYDGFGRRFTYYLPSNLTCLNGSTTNVNFHINEDRLAIVKNKSGSTTELHSYEGLAYVLISHGKNGFGAFTKSGNQVGYSNSSTDESENIDLDKIFVFNYFRPESMDDIIRFKDKWQLMVDLDSLEEVKRYPSDECTCTNISVTKFNDLCFN